ncbi:cellulase family glycosylhydrolase [Hymenobacter sp. GOD-10R]|uniref:cellulase family glycosylhydrolase n=1 Tax=Hymenobacter sp. GOD-10R TaxID=3093922 RepID=UPI002D78AD4F|nr:cellulase family glycosylhydrolase [Hymenobacter sp. GOD-10R]WRQ26789.1 cellulase family glycosylhydrolase [Hymenobacter sp. GOD-10R]
MNKSFITLLFCLVWGAVAHTAVAQRTAQRKQGDVYVDKQGVLRWQQGKQEVALFGVNYTTPFAYAYRAHQQLGVSHEQAIAQDVYHLSRLGLDAFRVHVWDIEITDTLGNLQDNEHLRLLDYLLAQLKQRGIKAILTPIAYWGNAYPEPNNTGTGFSSIYNKQQAYTNPRAIKAQENYLTQFLNHRNPYTKLLNREDPDIIAFEVCNEPSYHKPEEQVTSFANRMAQAIRATGCRKPVFYNIAENPSVHEAILNANVDGLTFQWYPQGLVSGHTLRGNFLPFVDQYPIPYQKDARFQRRAKMVYEFESADILQPVMYPFMARSFREAGFQWATQFAYDPMVIAYANTEYQTHYLNLAYTPSKAMSLLIASKVFHDVKRNQAFPRYPADSVFDAFHVSYRQGLSEMNTAEEFLYTSTTQTAPRKAVSLQHVAGVGSSPIVAYQGTGAYFLDKLAPGVWRLEVMPDAVALRDPFERTSLQKIVTQIIWNNQPMRVALPDLGTTFTVQGLSEGNTFRATATGGNVVLRPGAYLLASPGKNTAAWTAQTTVSNRKLGEFVAPPPTKLPVQVVHTPVVQATAGQPLEVKAQVTGAEAADSVVLVARSYYGATRTLTMTRPTLLTATATVPAELLRAGLLQYWIVVRKPEQALTFPGGFAGTPRDWDYFHAEHWEVPVVAANAPLTLYNAQADKEQVDVARLARSSYSDYVTSAAGALNLRLLVPTPRSGELANEPGPAIALRAYLGQKLQARATALSGFKELVVKARASQPGANVKLVLATKEAAAYSAAVPVSEEMREIRVPLASLQPDALLLIPRPYPSFLPFAFQTTAAPKPLTLSDIEVLQLIVVAGPDGTAPSLDIESVRLE